MLIVNYKNNKNIDVYFEKFDWTFYNTTYIHFKNGNIKCPYEPRVYGYGYIGEGKYKTSKNNKNTRCYTTWKSMLRRCYDKRFQEEHLTYINCTVCEEWHNYQNFARWYEENYYEVEGEKMSLDKDILIKGNKIYSPKTCIFTPQTINSLFIKCDKSRGKQPIGITETNIGSYKVYCNNKGKLQRLGTYYNKNEAFQVYKTYKENLIKQVAEEYKPYIPQKLYDAMYEYKVDIND